MADTQLDGSGTWNCLAQWDYRSAVSAVLSLALSDADWKSLGAGTGVFQKSCTETVCLPNETAYL